MLNQTTVNCLKSTQDRPTSSAGCPSNAHRSTINQTSAGSAAFYDLEARSWRYSEVFRTTVAWANISGNGGWRASYRNLPRLKRDSCTTYNHRYSTHQQRIQRAAIDSKSQHILLHVLCSNLLKRWNRPPAYRLFRCDSITGRLYELLTPRRP